MCGIAGFNCSRHLLENRGPDWAAAVTITALRMNEIRGKDASGWMATYHPDDRPELEFDTTLWYNKAPESASEYVKNGPFPLSWPTGLAVHTRDYTKGHPSNNNNNHPVGFNGILVTHNGSIDNYQSIIADAKLTLEQKGKLGDVDSSAIPVFFRTITQPSNQLEELDAVIQSLHRLKGKYTFHAMWAHDPGVSLIVAGPDRPMWYMHNEAQGLHVYSSEKEGARAIYKHFALDKKSLREGELKEGSAMLIKSGAIIRKWEFELPPVGSVTYKDPTMERISSFPIELKNEATSHWTKDNAPITLDDAKDFVDAKLFCIQHNHGIPDQNFDENISKLLWQRPFSKTWIGWEADQVWVSIPDYELKGNTPPSWTNWKVRFFTVYKDTIEIVWDNNFKVLDIYNWDLQVKGYPWMPLAKEPEKPKTKTVDVTDKTWFNRRLNKEAPIAEKQVKAREEKKKLYVATGKPVNAVLFDDDYNDYFVPHESEVDLVFMQNKWCSEHKELYSIHAKPLECKAAVESAWDMLAYVTDLDDAKDLYEGAVMQTRGKSACHSINEAHVWEIIGKNVITVSIDPPNRFAQHIEYEVTYPVGERCSRPQCELRRFWTNPPFFGMTKQPKLVGELVKK